MATSLGPTTASAAVSVTEKARRPTAFLPLSHRHFVLRSNSVSFRLTARPKLRFLSKVVVDGSTKAAASTSAKSEISLSEPSHNALASEESISQCKHEIL